MEEEHSFPLDNNMLGRVEDMITLNYLTPLRMQCL